MREYRREYRVNYTRKKELFKDLSKEERANECNNIICPKCGYQNHIYYVNKYGTCNLCHTILSKNYFIKKMLKICKN